MFGRGVQQVYVVLVKGSVHFVNKQIFYDEPQLHVQQNVTSILGTEKYIHQCLSLDLIAPIETKCLIIL